MKFILGILVGVLVIAPMLADPASAVEIGKIIVGKIISVGVPIAEEVAEEALPVLAQAGKDVVTDFVKEATPAITEAGKEIIGGVI